MKIAVIAGLIILVTLIVGVFIYNNKGKSPFPDKQPNISQEVVDLLKAFEGSPSATQVESVKVLAKEGDKFEVNSCQVKDPIIKTSQTKISVENIGQEEINISLAGKTEKISGRSQAEFPVDLGVIYQLRCSGNNLPEKTVGLLQTLIQDIGIDQLIASQEAEIRKQAQETDRLEFNNCQPSEKAVKLKAGEVLKLTNNDNQELLFSAGIGLNFTIAAGETKELKTDSQSGIPKGITKFGCILDKRVLSSGTIVVE